MFEYHDEPLATSSKLPNKVADDSIRARFTKIRQLVNRQLLDNENSRKGKEEIGYIMEIDHPTLNPSPLHGEGKSPLATECEVTLVVRPTLHCPEIDSYDEISLEQIIGTFEETNELAV
ncbi:MAG: hypothetical protein WCL02_00350 [bacterium]